MKKEEFSLSLKDKQLLDSLDFSVFNAAMEIMQKSQCNSRYVRYKSPSIVSARLSPTQIKYIEIKEREKRSLPPLNTYSKSKVSPMQNQLGINQKFLKEKTKNNTKINLLDNHNQDKEISFLEITGLGNVHLNPLKEDIVKKNKKMVQEFRRMSISFLENEKREKY